MKSLQKSHDTGSDTSAETIGSDSGRGGSESDMPHSANIPGNYTFSILNMFLKKKMVSRDPRGGLSLYLLV